MTQLIRMIQIIDIISIIHTVGSINCDRSAEALSNFQNRDHGAIEGLVASISRYHWQPTTMENRSNTQQ